jgi:drug/metabolite transporter (DMT)-like permease
VSSVDDFFWNFFVNTNQKAAMILMAGEMVIAMMIAMVKTIPAVPVWEVLFFRYLFGLMLLWPGLHQQGLAGIRTSRFSLHLFRSVTGMLAMGSFFFLVTRVPLAEATLAKLTAPFFVPLIARWWLGKGIGPMTWLAILLGFVGVGFVLRPGTTQFEPVLLVGVGGALMMSLAKVSIASMKHTEPAIRVMFWFFFLSLLMTGIPTLIYWHPPRQSRMAHVVWCGSGRYLWPAVADDGIPERQPGLYRSFCLQFNHFCCPDGLVVLE